MKLSNLHGLGKLVKYLLLVHCIVIYSSTKHVGALKKSFYSVRAFQIEFGSVGV